MLPTDEWLAQAEELPMGRRSRVDHICGGGRTLTIEHKPDGYSAWCYRCSDKGWQPHPQPSLAERIARLRAVEAAENAAKAQQAPPVPTSYDPRDWPLLARVWLYQAGFNNDTIMQHGFYYAAGLDRVVLPVIHEGRVVYWQARGFDPKRPKYLNPDCDKPVARFGDTGPFVLTEDILSAARVGLAGARGRAILGTSLPDWQSREIVHEAAGRAIILWLDGDAAGRKGRGRIGASLRLLGGDVRLIRTPLDPKLYSTHQLEEFIALAST